MDIVDIAIQQIGKNEKNGTHMEFINWYGGFSKGTPWCAIFVSYCAAKAGVSTSVIPKYSYCPTGRDWFKQRGLFKYRGSYTPKRGDIVFFTTNRSHTGIVERVSGSTLHTIEGNTSDKVARRTYSLNEKTLTGYGVPNYQNALQGTGNNSTGQGSNDSDQSKQQSQELEYLKKVLEKRKNITPVSDPNTYKISQLTKTDDIECYIFVQDGKKLFIPAVLENITLSYERIGTPGRLEFECVIDDKNPIMEGNKVLLCVDGIEIFSGFVFVRQFSKQSTMKVTAYNQLRYLKNKDSYVYVNKTASQIIKMIAKDYRLTTGTIADTKHVMSRTEDGLTLFDIIQNALDETLMLKQELYVLYDDVGKLTLKNISQMKVNIVIDEETGEDYSYKTSIDSNVYNQIKIAFTDKDGKGDYRIEDDVKNISQWGFLQYYEKIDNPKIASLKAKALLDLYNKKYKSLSLSGVFGNTAVIAGSLVPVMLNLGELKVREYMMVDKVTHKFSNRVHTMDLSVSGGDFDRN